MKSHPQDKHYCSCSGKAVGNVAEVVCMPPTWFSQIDTLCKSNMKKK